jgi:ABC transporter transmembrane region.
MTLVSNDVERFMQATLFASYVIWAPLQAIAILVIGLHLIGPAFAIGIGLLLFVFIPLQFYLSKHFALLRSKVRFSMHYIISIFLHTLIATF